MSKRRKGGKGKSYEIRNLGLVILRCQYPGEFSYGKLGDIFNINPKTAEEIFKRDHEKHLLAMGITCKCSQKA